MAAPELTFSITGNKISAVSGYDSITVTFLSDIAYTAFECRATKSGEDWGRGKGALIASFSQTPAGTQIPATGGSTNVSGTAGGYKKNTAINVTVKGADLEAASSGDGVKIVKVFVKNAAGTWSAA